MSKKQPRHRDLHIKLGDNLSIPLDEFADKRGVSKSEVVRHALTSLFEMEPIDPTNYTAVKISVEKYFKYPTGYNVRSFYNTLFKFAQVIPNHSVRKIWGEWVYVGTEDYTNKQIYSLILAEKNKILEKYGKEDTEDRPS